MAWSYNTVQRTGVRVRGSHFVLQVLVLLSLRHFLGEIKMSKTRKRAETLDFVKGLLISADEISKSLSGALEPRKVLAQKHKDIANFESEELQELGKYQGRVVLVALAAELALKFAWETENSSKGAAPGRHNLKELFCQLKGVRKEKIRVEYDKRFKTLQTQAEFSDTHELEWKTVDQVFRNCRNAFDGWRYVVEKGKLPTYIMRATFLSEATWSVIESASD